MKRIYFVLVVLYAVGWTACGHAVQFPVPSSGVVSSSPVERASEDKTSNVQIEGEGVVIRILKDDITGDRHQRFIVRLASDRTLLIAHNIDIAPRVAGLQTGDSVRFYGEYVWNEKGGLVHWTHHDPKGRHAAGWIKHDGQTYQ